MADSNFVRFRGPPVITTGMPANQCLLQTAAQTVATICAPSKFFVRAKTGAFTFTPFAGAGGVIPQYGSAEQNLLDPHPCFSGSRTGVTFEGPFLKYTVAQGSMSFNRMKGTHDNAAIVYFFDLVGDRMIYLPYPGTVEVIGQYPGTWDFETFIMEDSFDRGVPDPFTASQPTALDANATLSLRIAAVPATPSTREFKAIPPGCHSLTVNTTFMGSGGVFPTVTLFQETSPPARGTFFGPTGQPLNSTVPLMVYGATTSAFGTRLAQHNAWGASIDTGTGVTANDGMCQWHIGYT